MYSGVFWFPHLQLFGDGRWFDVLGPGRAVTCFATPPTPWEGADTCLLPSLSSCSLAFRWRYWYFSVSSAPGAVYRHRPPVQVPGFSTKPVVTLPDSPGLRRCRYQSRVRPFSLWKAPATILVRKLCCAPRFTWNPRLPVPSPVPRTSRGVM